MPMVIESITSSTPVPLAQASDPRVFRLNSLCDIEAAVLSYRQDERQ
jgi:hypothetical protein